MKGSLFSLVLFGFPLKFICNVNEMVKHSSVQLVAVMHLLAGLPTANKHKEEEEEEEEEICAEFWSKVQGTEGTHMESCWTVLLP